MRAWGRVRRPCVSGWLLLSGVWGLCAVAAAAPRGDYNVFLEQTYTDNAPLEADAQSDWLTVLGVEGVLSEHGGRLDADLRARVAREEYYRNTVEDDTALSLLADTRFWLRPRTLSWAFYDRFARVGETVEDAERPGAQQNANVVWTGPDAAFHLGPVDDWLLGGRVGHTYFESDADSVRYAANTGWRHRTDENAELTVIGRAQQVDFKEQSDTAIDYDRYDLFAGHQRTGGSPLQWRAQLGMSRVELDGRDSDDALLLDSEVTYRRSAPTLVGARLAHQYTDATGRLLDTSGILRGLEPVTDLSVGTSLIYERRYELFFRREAPIWTAEARGYYVDEDFKTEDSDRDISGLRLSGSRSLSARADLGGEVYGERIHYQLFEREDKDYGASVSLTWRLGSELRLRGAVGHIVRNSDVDAAEYEENRVLIALVYGGSLD
ncbi:hypothetical protein KBTX_02595 [wastewater metagenome]|uniref:TIGR03016 family PEP-CTERM system-associated outer membrane protein n=2 Tax=unclassified sequences TaxID=12908 RepID=A0A5B8RFH0_9ZZZZ|nr:hypothetical protein KBTEX_02595 [uncultured organism]